MTWNRGASLECERSEAFEESEIVGDSELEALKAESASLKGERPLRRLRLEEERASADETRAAKSDESAESL